jgi:hypothetical protein
MSNSPNPLADFCLTGFVWVSALEPCHAIWPDWKSLFVPLGYPGMA